MLPLSMYLEDDIANAWAALSSVGKFACTILEGSDVGQSIFADCVESFEEGIGRRFFCLFGRTCRIDRNILQLHAVKQLFRCCSIRLKERMQYIFQIL